mmetsp:Transcript_15548/g.44879  ORF Transcript_15548/g.44879 Transcript_15548/m.44879 type:complete len:241 (+) Transcript_15548:1622-2344(+)
MSRESRGGGLDGQCELEAGHQQRGRPAPLRRHRLLLERRLGERRVVLHRPERGGAAGLLQGFHLQSLGLLRPRRAVGRLRLGAGVRHPRQRAQDRANRGWRHPAGDPEPRRPPFRRSLADQHHRPGHDPGWLRVRRRCEVHDDVLRLQPADLGDSERERHVVLPQHHGGREHLAGQRLAERWWHGLARLPRRGQLGALGGHLGGGLRAPLRARPALQIFHGRLRQHLAASSTRLDLLLFR